MLLTLWTQYWRNDPNFVEGESVSFNQSAAVAVVAKANATQPISVAESTSVQVIVKASATQAISIAQSASGKVVTHVTATQPISIAQINTVHVITHATATQPISIAQVDAVAVRVKASATQPISIAQTDTVNVLVKSSATQPISIAQSASGTVSGALGTISGTADQPILINQIAGTPAQGVGSGGRWRGMRRVRRVIVADGSADQSLSIMQIATGSVFYDPIMLDEDLMMMAA